MLGYASVVLGGILDFFLTDPFFRSLTAGTNTANWNPLLSPMFFHGVPFAASVSIVGMILAVVAGGE